MSAFKFQQFQCQYFRVSNFSDSIFGPTLRYRRTLTRVVTALHGRHEPRERREGTIRSLLVEDLLAEETVLVTPHARHNDVRQMYCGRAALAPYTGIRT